jgi:hypothetical protein
VPIVVIRTPKVPSRASQEKGIGVNLNSEAPQLKLHHSLSWASLNVGTSLPLEKQERLQARQEARTIRKLTGSEFATEI